MNGGYDYRERLGPPAAGARVLDWLVLRYRHSDAPTWRERIASGQVSLDGATASGAEVLRPGQVLVWRRPPWEEPQVPLGFAILHRDANLLAVAKPRGLPTVPNGGFLEHTLLHQVRRLFPEAVPAHRLGRGTSGLVAFARTPVARGVLAAAWREGRIEKEYRALVVGHPTADAFTVDVAIGLVPHPALGRIHAATPDGRPAVSHVHVLERRNRTSLVSEQTSLVSVRIPTGRPHQIRIHLAASGHPLAGDPLYTTGGLPCSKPALPGEGGYWLHAHRLVLAHPVSGERLALECIPPPELCRGPS